MAKLAKRELQEIIARDMPGYKLARQYVSDEHVAPADEVAPDIETLRRKYLGDDDESTADNPGEPNAPEDTGDEIVAVEPAKGEDRVAGQSHAKTVVVSGKSKRVIGRQG